MPAWRMASSVGASLRRHKTPQRLGQSEQRGLDDALAVDPIAQDSTPYLCAVKWLLREIEVPRSALRIPPPERRNLGGLGQAVDVLTRHVIGEVYLTRPRRRGAGDPPLEGHPSE
jgi:hypothetical protein